MARTYPQATGIRLVRGAEDRVISGVAAGIAARFGLDVVLVRVAFLVLCLGGGLGLLLYGVAWAAMPEAQREVRRRKLSGARQVIAVACLVGGLLLLARASGLWLGDPIVWPLAAVTLGSMFVWIRVGESDRRLTPAEGSSSVVWKTRAMSLGRMVAGFGLVIGGTLAVLDAYSPVSIGRVVLPITIAVTGLLLALGPWLLRLSRQLSLERRERIRSEERSALAAHLHDSVLQTLALIQRSPADATTLARQQERELRAWLYGATPTSQGATLRVALDDVTAKMERMHRIPIETIVVGDAPMDEALGALVKATGEAMHNAGRHSGATAVSVYAEVDNGSVTAYVRDEGQGFDTANVPGDRRGIADSIRGRVARHGGTGEVKSTVGSGTEVKIMVPRRAS
jgi:signal transduction histidine kinase/phage shock protein PspC (stress-responsive transcriptional regulator)